MTSFSQHFQEMRKVSSQILAKVICVKFHQNRPNGAKMKGCDRQTDTQTDTQTDAETGLIPGVNIFSNEMTEYKNQDEFDTTRTCLREIACLVLCNFRFMC